MQRTTTGLRSSRRRDVEVAATALIRSVLEPGWTAPAAAEALHARVRGNRNVLLVLRARVARELSRGWTPLGQRAAATVDAALALGTSVPEEQAVDQPPVPAGTAA